MSNIYIISDSHFGHDNMVVWALRPENFGEKIWDGLKTIPDDAVLVHCGDVSMGSDALSHMKLAEFKFKKWLVRGNHDGHSVDWYIRNGWDAVMDEFTLDAFGEKILFSHEPLPRREGVTKNIHGHLHGSKSHPRPPFYEDGYHVEVCPEVIGYLPAKLGTKIL